MLSGAYGTANNDSLCSFYSYILKRGGGSTRQGIRCLRVEYIFTYSYGGPKLNRISYSAGGGKKIEYRYSRRRRKTNTYIRYIHAAGAGGGEVLYSPR